MAGRPLVFSSTVLVGVLLPFKTTEWIAFFFFFICYCLCLYNLWKPIVTNNIQRHLDVPKWWCPPAQHNELCHIFAACCPLSAHLACFPFVFLAVFRLLCELVCGIFLSSKLCLLATVVRGACLIIFCLFVNKKLFAPEVLCNTVLPRLMSQCMFSLALVPPGFSTNACLACSMLCNVAVPMHYSRLWKWKHKKPVQDKKKLPAM